VKPAPITVRRFDPATGEMLVDPETREIIEEVIPAKDFRPQPPELPKIDPTMITLVKRGTVSAPTGRSVVYMSSHREAVIAYWEFHAHILSRKERSALLNNDAHSVLRPIPPEWEPGDRMYLASNMEAEVVEVTESDRGHGTVFRIHDYRVMYLRRGVLGHDTPKTDEDGYALALDPDVERQAARDSAYTTVASQAVDEAGAVMEGHAYERIHGDRGAGRALTQSKRRVRLSIDGIEKRLREAKAKGQKATVKVLERKLKAATGRLQQVA